MHELSVCPACRVEVRSGSLRTLDCVTRLAHFSVSRADNVFENVDMFRFDDTEDTLFKNNVFPGDACLNADDSTFTSGSDLPEDCY